MKPYYESGGVPYYSARSLLGLGLYHENLQMWLRCCTGRTTVSVGVRPQLEKAQAHGRPLCRHCCRTAQGMANEAQAASRWFDNGRLRRLRAREGSTRQGALDTAAHSCRSRDARATAQHVGVRTSRQRRPHRQQAGKPLRLSRPFPAQRRPPFGECGVSPAPSGWPCRIPGRSL